MPIVTSLLSHYPHLLALSASSPYWDGEDAGYVSNRAMMFQQLPTAGLPFHFQTWAQWGLRSRPEEDRHHRPHERDPLGYPAFTAPWHGGGSRIRRCLNIRELGALVALTHCLIVDLDRRLDAGEQLPTIPPWHVQESKWRAARYGTSTRR